MSTRRENDVSHAAARFDAVNASDPLFNPSRFQREVIVHDRGSESLKIQTLFRRRITDEDAMRFVRLKRTRSFAAEFVANDSVSAERTLECGGDEVGGLFVVDEYHHLRDLAVGLQPLRQLEGSHVVLEGSGDELAALPEQGFLAIKRPSGREEFAFSKREGGRWSVRPEREAGVDATYEHERMRESRLDPDREQALQSLRLIKVRRRVCPCYGKSPCFEKVERLVARVVFVLDHDGTSSSRKVISDARVFSASTKQAAMQAIGLSNVRA